MNKFKLSSVLLAILFLFCFKAEGQIIAVGGSTEDQFLSNFVSFAGKGNPKNARIFILAAARLSPSSQCNTFSAYTSSFKDLAVPSEQIFCPLITTREEAESEAVLNMLSEATGLCVSGGDQHILMQRIHSTKFHKMLLDKLDQLVYYGNSAGTAVIGDMMIARSSERSGEIEIEPGLGIIKGCVFDQHVKQRERGWRLIKFIEDHPNYNGIAIDEQTALTVYPDGTRKWYGNGEVQFINPFNKGDEVEKVSLRSPQGTTN